MLNNLLHKPINRETKYKVNIDIFKNELIPIRFYFEEKTDDKYKLQIVDSENFKENEIKNFLRILNKFQGNTIIYIPNYGILKTVIFDNCYIWDEGYWMADNLNEVKNYYKKHNPDKYNEIEHQCYMATLKARVEIKEEYDKPENQLKRKMKEIKNILSKK